jgi:ElaB/YqjD/DUF883 family membrane-anchored ribosome-binding protein
MANNMTPEKVREGFGNVADRAKDAAGNFADKAKDAAGTMADKAKETASNVTHRAEDLAKNAGKRIDDATASVGQGIRSAGETVREKGPHDGFLGSATSATAGALENTGRFIEEEKLSGMAADVTNVIKRNPIPFVLLALGVGILLGRLTKS